MGILYFSFFWARDFCKKIDLHGGFFFRVWIFYFETIYRQVFENESIMVWVIYGLLRGFARCIETK